MAVDIANTADNWGFDKSWLLELKPEIKPAKLAKSLLVCVLNMNEGKPLERLFSRLLVGLIRAPQAQQLGDCLPSLERPFLIHPAQHQRVFGRVPHLVVMLVVVQRPAGRLEHKPEPVVDVDPPRRAEFEHRVLVL